MPKASMNPIPRNIRITSWRIFSMMLPLLISFPIVAQDVHFSQFSSAPLLVNPALTGTSEVTSRIAALYRNQWSKLGIPYQTLYISADGAPSSFSGHMGLGGAVIHDQAAAFRLSADEVMFSVSYSLYAGNHQISFGVQPGMVFKSLAYESLTFSSQFDGTDNVFDPGVSSGENLTGNLHHIDLAAGIYWRTLYHNVMPSAGISIRHLNRPVESFASGIAETRLPMNLTFHTRTAIPVGEKLEIAPTLLFGYMAGSTEWISGTELEYRLSAPALPVSAIRGMAMVRLNPWKNADAIILGAVIQLNLFDLGFSWDMNISPLAHSTGVRGSYEISLIYRGKRKTTNYAAQSCTVN